MLKSRTSQWTVGAALLSVVILAASWFLLVSPRRSHADDLRSQADAADSQAQLARTKTAQLKAQFADLPKQKAELAAIRAQLPPKAGVPALVSDLQVQAAAAGVSLTSIVPGTPAVVGAAAAGSGSSSTTLAPAGSVVSIPLTVTASGDYFEDALFTKYLQTKLTRAFLVNTVTTTSSASTSATSTPTATSTATPTPTAAATTSATSPVQMTVTGAVFVLLDSTSTLSQVAKDAKSATS